MSNLAIFVVGVFVSALCLFFLGFSVWELRRLGREAEARRVEESQIPQA